MSLLSMWTTLCGFYTFDSHNTKLMRTVKVYCCVASVLYFVSCLAYLFHWLLTVEEVTYGTVAFLFMDTVSIIMFTYYRIMYIKYHDDYHSVYENLDYVDKCLESVHNNVPLDLSVQMFCVTQAVFSIAIHFVLKVDHHRHSVTYTHKTNHLVDTVSC